MRNPRSSHTRFQSAPVVGRRPPVRATMFDDQYRASCQPCARGRAATVWLKSESATTERQMNKRITPAESNRGGKRWQELHD